MARGHRRGGGSAWRMAAACVGRRQPGHVAAFRVRPLTLLRTSGLTVCVPGAAAAWRPAGRWGSLSRYSHRCCVECAAAHAPPPTQSSLGAGRPLPVFEHAGGAAKLQKRGLGRIELPTSSTLRKNHTTRPKSLDAPRLPCHLRSHPGRDPDVGRRGRREEGDANLQFVQGPSPAVAATMSCSIVTHAWVFLNAV